MAIDAMELFGVKLKRCTVLLAVLTSVAPLLLSGGDGANRLDWWREVRFGLFIHYGLYATASKGEWTKSIDRVSDEAYDVYRSSARTSRCRSSN